MWTVEHSYSKSPPGGQWDIMIVQSEAEAIEQARKYIDAGLVVNVIKKPGDEVAYTQKQIYAKLNKAVP